jgi:biopolymer transport protein ExbB
MAWNISIAEYLAMGGWVMLPLVILAFVLALLISERVLFYWELGRNDITPDTLIDLLEKNRVSDNSRSGICNQLLNLFLGAKKRYGKLDMMIIEEITKGFIPELTKNLLIIAALTKAAPLLGLLGTVSGMITTFNVMNIFGTGNAKAMSGGISEALITTQFGLVVAIIGIYVSMILTRRARHFETLVQEIGVHIMRKFRL